MKETMSNSRLGRLSTQNRNNWLIDAALCLGAVVAVLSGTYFLFLPSGGYQGGRNPMVGVTILFSRHTWEAVHTWGGIAVIGAGIVHFALHWGWVRMMARRTVNSLISRRLLLSRKAAGNLILVVLVTLSFLLTAASGIYFLFVPLGGYQGGRNLGWDPGFLFSRTTWDLIHTWAGVVLIGAAVVHFWIHWRWVTKVTQRVVTSLFARPKPSRLSTAMQS
jgi:hypothetical protein